MTPTPYRPCIGRPNGPKADPCGRLTAAKSGKCCRCVEAAQFEAARERYEKGGEKGQMRMGEGT